MNIIKRIRNKAKFIVFEGLDGCGKTTQVQLLSERLKKEGIPHITTKEPSDSNPVGRLAREAVHVTRLQEMAKMRSPFLATGFNDKKNVHEVEIVGDFTQSNGNCINEAIKFPNNSAAEGFTLLEGTCFSKANRLENETLALLFAADRYEHVTKEIIPALNAGFHVLCDRYYYSNFAYQGDVSAYNRIVMEHYRPDITFFIDEEPEECIQRIQKKRLNDACGIYETIETLQQVRSRFLEICSSLRKTDNILLIDSRGLSIEGVADIIHMRIKQF